MRTLVCAEVIGEDMIVTGGTLVIVLSAANLLAETIERVFTDRSVSSVFKELELFQPAA